MVALRRAATGSLLAVTMAPAALAAQGVTVGGLVYTQFVYQLKDTANHVNNFDVTRSYLNVIGRFAGGVSTRVTGDIYRNLDGSLAYRLKYVFVSYTPGHGPLTYKIGQIHTPWLDWEEALWDYRMQGSMALERGDQIAPRSYLSSADFGLGVDGAWSAERVNLQVALVNGENYNKAPGDQRKDVMGRVSLRLLETDDSTRLGGLRLSGYGQLGKPTTGGRRNRFLGMVSYRSKRATLSAEYAITRDSVTAGPVPETDGRVFSAFGVYHIPRSKAAVVGRLDVLDPNTNAANDRQTRIIGGVSYELSPHLRLLADLDHLSYQGGAPTAPLEAARSQALFQAQFTF